jgi:hypothetical protein
MNGQSDWSQLIFEIRRNIFNLIFFPIEGGGCAMTTMTATTTTPTTSAPVVAPKKRPTANMTAAKRRRRRLAENQVELDDALQNLYKDVVYNH